MEFKANSTLTRCLITACIFFLLVSVKVVYGETDDTVGGLLGNPLRFEITYPTKATVNENLQVTIRLWTVLEQLDVEQVNLVIEYMNGELIYEETILHNDRLTETKVVKTITIKPTRADDKIKARLNAIYLEPIGADLEGELIYSRNQYENSRDLYMEISSPQFWTPNLIAAVVIVVISLIAVIVVMFKSKSLTKKV